MIPLTMFGGAFLCFEGVEKLAHKLLHSKAEPVHEDEKRAISFLWDGRDAHIVRGTTMRPLGNVDARADPLDRGRRGLRLIASRLRYSDSERGPVVLPAGQESPPPQTARARRTVGP